MDARTKQFVVRLTPEEYAQLVALADKEHVAPAVFARDVILDRMRINLSGPERAQLAATLRLHTVYMAVLKASLARRMSAEKLAEIETTTRIHNADIVMAFLEEMVL